MERHVAVGITSIDIGLSIKKELDTLVMAFRCCEMERRILGSGATSINIGLSIKEKRDTLMVAIR